MRLGHCALAINAAVLLKLVYVPLGELPWEMTIP
jgi:hypothetical protein